MRILLTGATGFIGSNLAGELAAGGHRLSCLVRKTSDSGFLRALGAELFYGDVRDEKALASLPSCDVIFHCAARVMDDDLKRLRECNVRGTENVCRLGMRLGIRRLVYLSSVAVVSGNPQALLKEDMPYAATNNYGVSKIEAEKVVREFRRAGMPCAIVRPPMVYGEGEPHAQARLCMLLRRRLFPLFDRGERLVHMVYVRNLVAALLLAMEAREFLRNTFFAADSETLTMGEAARILAAAINAPPPVILGTAVSSFLSRLPWAGRRIVFFRRDRTYDTTGIISAGYRDIVPVREALERTGRWWLEHRGCRGR